MTRLTRHWKVGFLLAAVMALVAWKAAGSLAPSWGLPTFGLPDTASASGRLSGQRVITPPAPAEPPPQPLPIFLPPESATASPAAAAPTATASPSGRAPAAPAGAAAKPTSTPTPTAAAAPPRPLTPMEKQTARDQAAAAFESLFGESVRKVQATRDVHDDLDLASTLLAAARSAKDQPAMLSLVAWEADDLVGRIPDGYPIAIEVLQLLADNVPEDRSEALDELVNVCQLAYARSRGADRDKAAERLIDAARALGDDRAEEGDFVKAAAAYRRAIDAATAIKSPDLAAIQAKYQYANTRQGMMLQVDRLAKQLESTPTDTAAREELIRLTLVEFDSPDRAAKFLDPKAADVRSKLVLLAGMTPGNLPEAACLQLGEWYASLADQGSPPARLTMLTRARTYYQVFLDKHAAADAQKTQATIALHAVEDRIAKISPKPRIPPGAVLVFTFDRATATAQAGQNVLRDLSPQGNHGIVRGGTIAKGLVGDAMTFDGVSSSVDCGVKQSLQIAGDETIAFWFMPAKVGPRMTVINKNYTTDGAITVEATTGQMLYFYGTATSTGPTYTFFPCSAPLEVGAWNHVVLIRDFTNKKFMWYRNGKKVDEAKPAFAAVSPSAQPLVIGAGFAGPLAGRLDELAIFGRALTEKEIQTLFDMGQKGVSLGGK